MDASNTTKTMLALTTFAELGAMVGPYTGDYPTAFSVLGVINKYLGALDWGTLTPWQVVWGPAIYSFPININGPQIDNIVYMVKNPATNDYAIAIAGTNGASIADLVIEDLITAITVPWSKIASTNDGTNPQISYSTYVALNIILGISPPVAPAGTPPANTIPGAGQTLKSFISANFGNKPVNLYVTGHSLGGALSPALSLALADTMPQCGPKGNVKLLPYSFAGPTGGDADYVKHFLNQVPAGLQRIWNALDIVPQVWDAKQLANLPGIYGSTIGTVNDVVKFIIGATQNIGYAHCDPSNQPTPALFSGPQQNPNITDIDAYQKEVGWQHVVAYAQHFGLTTSNS